MQEQNNLRADKDPWQPCDVRVILLSRNLDRRAVDEIYRFNQHNNGGRPKPSRTAWSKGLGSGA
jgi:hypothetical protein